MLELYIWMASMGFVIGFTIGRTQRGGEEAEVDQ